jgi:hypothetical protein
MAYISAMILGLTESILFSGHFALLFYLLIVSEKLSTEPSAESIQVRVRRAFSYD